MTIPRRLRLLQACHSHLYSEVKITLATDKELRALRHLGDKIEKGYVNLTKPQEVNHGEAKVKLQAYRKAVSEYQRFIMSQKGVSDGKA